MPGAQTPAQTVEQVAREPAAALTDRPTQVSGEPGIPHPRATVGKLRERFAEFRAGPRVHQTGARLFGQRHGTVEATVEVGEVGSAVVAGEELQLHQPGPAEIAQQLLGTGDQVLVHGHRDRARRGTVRRGEQTWADLLDAGAQAALVKNADERAQAAVDGALQDGLGTGSEDPIHLGPRGGSVGEEAGVNAVGASLALGPVSTALHHHGTVPGREFLRGS